MLQVALWEPEIPPNTGNIARLCAATNCPLHLIGRLGFRIDERSLRRAGVDYWDAVQLYRHNTLIEFEEVMHRQGSRSLCFSARMEKPYTSIRFETNDCLLFGTESHGLPPELLARYPEQTFTIPMPSGKVRSLNLATAAGIVLYEGLRQLHAW
jgi:tRNA (cytidine/uridine-2'-O-)-methyltransferase